MRWLLRATYVVAGAALSSVAGLVAGAARGESAAMPSLSLGGLAPVPVVSVLALVPVFCIMGGWSNVGWHALAQATRAPLLLATPVLVAGPATYTLTSAVLGGTGALLENGRDCLGLLGLALIGARLLGDRGAVLAPTAFLLAAFLFGRVPGASTPSWWAWVLADGASVWALAVAALLVVLGLVLLPRIPVSDLRRGGG